MRATAFASDSGSPDPPKQWVSMKWRLLCVAVTVLALFLVFHKISPPTLLNTLRGMHVGWFIAAVVLYGLMFLPAALRWWLALHVNDSVVHWPATLRFTIIGHFFYLMLFGGTGGDAAKATVYARRYDLRLSKTFASVWLDRLMGSGALLVVSAIAFTVAGLHGGFAGAKSLSIRHSAWWLLLAVPALAFSLFYLRRSRHESVLRRLAMAFIEGGKRLLASPALLLTGFSCSLLMQCAVNGILALNLQAVSHTPIPWLRLLWTFPLITTISGLPVTVAGIGARDGAAIALLGWCGIPNADAEAMSLLTLCVSAIWGLIGGIILWWESSRLTRQTAHSKPGSTRPL
jgi:uncharacterized membrane protein YbhN (UPF0104 family)